MRNILHSAGERSDVLAFVSENLRRLRQRAGLSQAALAEAAGLSRRMVVQLEGGDTNISLSSLDRLADALGASFIEIVSDPAAQRLRMDATREAQLWSWSLGPGERYQAEPDPEGWHEMIVVVEGRLLVDLSEGPMTIEAGDYAIYGSAQDYAYVNLHEGVTRFIRNVIS